MARILATLISGASYGLLFPPLGLGALAWVALVPLVLALRGMPAWRAGLLAALWGWVGTGGVITWLVPTLQQHFEQPLGFSVGFWLVFSATALSPYYAVALAAWAQLAERMSPVARVLLFAAAWVVAETARVHLGFESPWTRLGDSQVGAFHLRQIADLAGVYGISGVVALSNAALAELAWTAWSHRRTPSVEWRPPLLAAGLAAVVVAACVVYGVLRVQSLDGSEARSFQVAAVQGNLAPELRWRRLTASRVIRRYGDLTAGLARRDAPKPDLVVWPENAIQTSLDDPSYGPPVRRLARVAPLLLGAPHSVASPEGRRHFNTAHLVRPDGDVSRYHKRRLLPFSETRPFGGWSSFGRRGDLDVADYTPGVGPGVFVVDGAPIGVLICMEALYPELAREAVAEGASLLVNLSNDGWYRGRGGAEQHLSQVVFRAIETRTPVVRATTTGISAVVGPDGRIRARLGEGESGVLEASVALRAGSGPLYARLGDWLSVACGLALCGVALRRLLPRPDAGPADSRVREPAG